MSLFSKNSIIDILQNPKYALETMLITDAKLLQLMHL